MSRFKAQFFTDVTEIRQDMTGLTGSGKLILAFRPPQVEHDEHGNGDEMDIEDRQNFQGHIQNLVDHMNQLSYRLLEKYKPKDEYLYFLFGEQAGRIYNDSMEDNPAADVKKYADEYGYTYDTLAYKLGDNPLELLNEFNGWNDYTCIEKEEYEQFNA